MHGSPFAAIRFVEVTGDCSRKVEVSKQSTDFIVEEERAEEMENVII